MTIRTNGKLLSLFPVTMLLAACGDASDGGGSESGTAANEAAPIQSADATPTAFNQCKTCHKVEPGDHGLGPSLAGVVGKQAGSIEGFKYSPAMAGSGLTWDEATLDAYLKAPRQTVPGTTMSFSGVRDDAKRAELIEYLKTI